MIVCKKDEWDFPENFVLPGTEKAQSRGCSCPEQADSDAHVFLETCKVHEFIKVPVS